MTLTKLNTHSWKEYLWKIEGDEGGPLRMWIRDDDRIFEVGDGTFQTANSTHRHEQIFSSFEEAEKDFERKP